MKFKPIIKTKETEIITEIDGQLIVDIVEKSISVDYNKERIKVGMDSDVDNQIESVNNMLVDFKDRNSYGFEEVNTGKKWIDGSYIYRKTFALNIIDTANLSIVVGDIKSLFDVSDILLVGNSVATISTSTAFSRSVSATFAIIDGILNAYFTPTIRTVAGIWHLTVEYIKRPSLNDLSWVEIKQVADAGLAKKHWHIGDSKTVELSSGEQLVFEILGFDHDNMHNNMEVVGKAPITFGLRYLMAENRRMSHNSLTTGGWADSEMREWLNTTIFDMLPADLKEIIVEVIKSTEFSNANFIERAITADKLFLFSSLEIANHASIDDVNDRMYQFWNVNSGNIESNRVKKRSNSSGGPTWWWTRTSRNLTTYRNVGASGSWGTNPPSNQLGICFGFCI